MLDTSTLTGSLGEASTLDGGTASEPHAFQAASEFPVIPPELGDGEDFALGAV
ncbi:MAG: hypothetical protein J2P28_24495 [Actinobacteria bacterium]|nr:hypothetical protein [Actinomycetota bacterium]